MDQVRDLLSESIFRDGRVWLLVAVCILTIGTIQAVESAVEGIWPHQRRVSRMPVRAARAHGGWSVAAIPLLIGLLLSIANLLILVWRDLDQAQLHLYGGVLVAVGWLLFVLATADRFRARQYVAQLGRIAPIAIIVLLLVGDAFLLIALLEILPPSEEIREALPLLFAH